MKKTKSFEKKMDMILSESIKITSNPLNEGPFDFIKKLRNKIFNKKKKVEPEVDRPTAIENGKDALDTIYRTYLSAAKDLDKNKKYNDKYKKDRKNNLDSIVYSTLYDDVNWDTINKMTNFNIKGEVNKILKNEDDLISIGEYSGWLMDDVVESIWDSIK